MRILMIGTMLLAVAACARDGVGDTPFVGTWTVDGVALADARVAGTPYVVLQDGGRGEAYDGCNSGSGRWAAEGDEVVLGEWVTTLRGCLDVSLVAVISVGTPLTLDGDALLVPAADGGEPFRLVRVAS